MGAPANTGTITDAMILAAGRGRRMRPLSDHTPKPLLRPGGDGAPALIEYHLKALARCGVARVIINCAWLAGQLSATLGDGSRYGLHIQYSHEADGALGTGGAVVEALPLIRSEHFLLLSGDAWSDFPLERLLAPQLPGAGNDGCVVLVDNPPHHPAGDFRLEGARVRPCDGSHPCLTFSGIGVYARRLFETLAPGRFALAPILHEAARAERLAGIHHRGRWLDVGAPERLATLAALLAAD